MKKKPIVSVTYESERIHCYFCLPTSPELGFPVFSGFCFRVDLCNGKLNGFMFHRSPLLAALSSDAQKVTKDKKYRVGNNGTDRSEANQVSYGIL